MANEYNTMRTAAELQIDRFFGGHTDANIAAGIASDLNLNDQQLLAALIVQMLDRIETLEAP
jgi:hypothetical protein